MKRFKGALQIGCLWFVILGITGGSAAELPKFRGVSVYDPSNI